MSDLTARRLLDELESWTDLIYLIPQNEWVVYEEEGHPIIDEFKTVREYLKKTTSIIK